MFQQRITTHGWLLLLSMWLCAEAVADDRGRLGMRSRDDHHGGYYVPRPRAITPTRPFFVQPYPRDDSRRAFWHGYREGYRDGRTDRRRDGHRGYRRDDRHDKRSWHDGDDYRPRGYPGYGYPARRGFSLHDER